MKQRQSVTPTRLILRASRRYLGWRRSGVRGGDRWVMTILLSDPRVAALEVHDCGEPLVALDASFGPARARVRSGLAERLAVAQDLLPRGLRLRVVEGHRSVTDQRAIIASYSAEVCRLRPGISPHEL